MANKMPSITALDTMPLLDLNDLWARFYGVPAPSLSKDLLRRSLAYRLQEMTHGKLNQRVATYLSRYSSDDGSNKQKQQLGPKLSVGTKLVRDWHGVGHSVTVVEDGLEYNGQHWKSLTAIAREITGAKWSGPRFFGLTAKGITS